LLQELRVAQTGVQILFAFLLTVVFTPRFPGIDTFGRAVYLVALLSAAAATSLMIAPVAQHRLLFRQGEKLQLVVRAHELAVAGLLFLLLSMVTSVTLAVDLVLNRGAAIIVGLLTAVWFVLFWLVFPLLRRRNRSTVD
jgi:hypothetical protein